MTLLWLAFIVCPPIMGRCFGRKAAIANLGLLLIIVATIFEVNHQEMIASAPLMFAANLFIIFGYKMRLKGMFAFGIVLIPISFLLLLHT